MAYRTKRVSRADAMKTVMTHLMPNRTGAEVYVEDKYDVTELLRFISEYNGAHPEKKINLFQCCVTALMRMMWDKPQLNRFIQGRRMFAHNSVTLGFICKLNYEEDAGETGIILTAGPDDTLESIGERIRGELLAAKRNAAENTGYSSAVSRLARLPRPLLKMLMGVLKLLDRNGVEMEKLTQSDPNFCSVLLSNLGSIGLPASYHHLNDYGTNSMVVTMGVAHKEEIILNDGSRVVRDVLELGATSDERVADGFNYAQGVKLLKYVLRHPETLMQPFREPVKTDK